MFPDFDDMLAQFQEAMNSLQLPPEFDPPGLSMRRRFAEVGLDQPTLACIEKAAEAAHGRRPRAAEQWRQEAAYGGLMPEAMAYFADGQND
jgi:hypothetical protein